MPGIHEDRARQVIPAWRNFQVTADLQETASIAAAPINRFSDEMLSELLKDWEESKTVSVAADLVSVACAIGRFSVADQAAKFLQESPSVPLTIKQVADQY